MARLYHITVKADPAGPLADVPVILRVRKLLKYALRALGLRCVDIYAETVQPQRTGCRRNVERLVVGPVGR
jgi:hypothetical protein